MDLSFAFLRRLVPTALFALLTVGALGAQEQKIAVIDVQRILTDSATGQKIISELEELRTSKAAELEQLGSQLEDVTRRIDDGRLTLSQERLAELEQEREDLQVQARRAQDDAQRELQEKQRENFEQIESSVMPIIEQVGQEFGYTAIFNKFQSGLVYADEAIDITDMVIERFNASTGGN